MKILITGSKGQLGNEIRMLEEKGALNPKYKFVYTDYEELDITSARKVNAFFKEHKFKAVINCAAYTAVDKAESDLENCRAVNEIGPANLAKACAKFDAFMIHISTDYVFDGTKERGYLEDDATGPLGAYGITKLAGEEAVKKHLKRSATIRTSWVYSRFGHNFAKTMMRLSTRDEISVVADQTGCPTFAGDLAKAIFEVLEQRKKIKDNEMLHFTNYGECTWHNFACHIMDVMGSKCKVNPIPTSEYPTPAKRPEYSLLSTKKIRTKYGVEIPYWKNSVTRCVDYLMDEQKRSPKETV